MYIYTQWISLAHPKTAWLSSLSSSTIQRIILKKDFQVIETGHFSKLPYRAKGATSILIQGNKESTSLCDFNRMAGNTAFITVVM
jgi:hypothetical protein